MEPYLKIVKKCKKVIFTEYREHIGRGVYEEVKTALNNNIPVLLLRKTGSSHELIPIKGLKVFDPTDWKFKYGIAITEDITEPQTL
jgi:hypothetical protein